VSDQSVNTRALAVQELAEASVPTPEDAFSDIGPFGRLLYLQQLGYETLKLWVALLSGDQAEDIGEAGELEEAVMALAFACGNLDAACVAVGIMDAIAISPNSPATAAPGGLEG
jgi:hypothetical protein